MNTPMTKEREAEIRAGHCPSYAEVQYLFAELDRLRANENLAANYTLSDALEEENGK